MQITIRAVAAIVLTAGPVMARGPEDPGAVLKARGPTRSGVFITFRFAEETAEVLVFRRAELMASTAAALAENGIPAPCSEDLRRTWAGGVARR
jgi:hypothetical protein